MHNSIKYNSALVLYSVGFYSFLMQFFIWGIHDEVHIQEVCRLLVHHTFCILDFQVYSYVPLVCCCSCSCCDDRLPAVQLLFRIIWEGFAMSFMRKKRLLGFLALCVGLGIFFAVTVPTVGWVMFSAICLICVGIFLIRF